MILLSICASLVVCGESGILIDILNQAQQLRIAQLLDSF